MLLAVAMLLSLTRLSIGGDETWMLQVASRMSEGNVLYRDVFCGTMPLGFLIALAATTLLGTELYVIKLVVILSWLFSLFLSFDLVRQITGTVRYRAALLLGMLLYALPTEMALYQPLANLFLLAAFSSLLCWFEDSRLHARGALWMAGSFAGLALATKQNIGVYVLAAILASLLFSRESISRPRAALANCAHAIIPFLLIGVAVLALIALSGGWEKFLDYGFINKRRYLEVAGISYLDGLKWLLTARYERHPVSFVEALNNRLIFLAPALGVLGVLIIMFVRRSKMSRPDFVLAIFTGAALLSLYPRVDPLHVIVIAPGLFVAILCGWHALRAKIPFVIRWGVEAGVILLLLAGLAVRGMVLYTFLHSPGYAWSDLPHFRYLYLPAAEIAGYKSDIQALKAEAEKGPVLILFSDASRLYLLSDIRNPTPFDYPLITAFGVNGEADTIKAISEKRIRTVCLKKVYWILAPYRLDNFVEENLAPDSPLSSCRLYRVRE